MILSRRLWQALLLAPAQSSRLDYSQVYYHYRSAHAADEDADRFLWLRRIGRMIVLAFVMFLTLPVTVWGGICLAPIFFVISAGAAVSYSLQSAWRISTYISDERERNTYDLLCVTPSGQFGINWVLCVRFLRNNQNFDIFGRVFERLLSTSFTLIMVLIVLIGLVSITNTNPTTIQERNMLDGIPLLISIGALQYAFYLNFVQSLVIGNLIGMLVPTISRNKIDAQIYAVLLFITVIVVTLVIAIFSGFVILPQIMSLFVTDNSILSQCILPVLQLVLFFVVREVAVRALWHLVMSQMNVNAAEVNRILQPAL